MSKITFKLTSIVLYLQQQVPSIQLNSAYIAPVYNSSHLKVFIIS